MLVRVCKVGVAVLATSIVLGGCRTDRREVGVRNAGFIARDSTRRLGPGDLRIVSTDSSIEITLLGDNVMTGLADKALAKVKQEMDTAAVKGTGLSAKFERFVKSSVQSVVDKQVLFPVSSVGDVRYDDGNLEFFDQDGKRMAMFGRESRDSASRSGMFSPEDARAFIAAYRSKKALIR